MAFFDFSPSSPALVLQNSHYQSQSPAFSILNSRVFCPAWPCNRFYQHRASFVYIHYEHTLAHSVMEDPGRAIP